MTTPLNPFAVGVVKGIYSRLRASSETTDVVVHELWAK